MERAGPVSTALTTKSSPLFPPLPTSSRTRQCKYQWMGTLTSNRKDSFKCTLFTVSSAIHYEDGRDVCVPGSFSGSHCQGMPVSFLSSGAAERGQNGLEKVYRQRPLQWSWVQRLIALSMSPVRFHRVVPKIKVNIKL